MEASPTMPSTMDAAAPTAAYPLYPYHMVYSVPGAPAMMINAKDGAFLAMLQNPMMAAKAGAPVMVGATEDVQQQAQAPAQQPTYVNPKQYHRIMARRKARARLEAHRKTLAARKPFLHQSRHEHACRRPRGKGGRFLTKDELAALDEAKKLEEAAGGAGQQQQPPPQQQSAGGRAQGMKQAGAAGQGGHAAQVQHAWVQDDGEDDEEDEEEEESFEGGAAMKRTRVS